MVLMLYFLIYSPFQMIIPNSANIFGSQSLRKTLLGDNYIIVIKISRTYNKAMNQISEPCTNIKNPSTSKCIADWIQDKIGCRIKINGGGGFQDKLSMRPCISGWQFNWIFWQPKVGWPSPKLGDLPPREPPSGGQNCRQHGLQEVQDGLVLCAAIFGCKLTPPICVDAKFASRSPCL